MHVECDKGRTSKPGEAAKQSRAHTSSSSRFDSRRISLSLSLPLSLFSLSLSSLSLSLFSLSLSLIQPCNPARHVRGTRQPVLRPALDALDRRLGR